MSPRPRKPWSPDNLEASHQRRGLKLLRELGWRTWTLNQHRASNVAPGVPDVYALHPRHGALWWEAKGTTGHKQSPKQVEFQAACTECRVAYVCGTIDDLKQYLGIPLYTEAA
jgi:hypothetical protein